MSAFDRLAASGSRGLAQELTLPELSSFGVTSSAPMTVVGGASVAMFALGVPGTPLFFVAVGVVLGVWVVGYAALSQHVQSAGAQAAFITRGLGRVPGVAAQGVALVAYGAIYLCLYGLFGTVAAPVVARWTPLDPPWWTCAGVAAIGVGLLGRTRVKIAGRVLTCLLAAEVLAVVLVDVAGFVHPAGGSVDLSDIDPGSLLHHGWAGAGGVLAYAVASYVGCEETPGLAEDAHNGHRDVRRALLIAVSFLGVFYTVSFLALSVGEGPGAVATTAADPASGFPFDLVARAYGTAGPALADVANVLLVTSVFAALASFHTVCTRYAYSGGRDRVLPALFGRINPRNSSPSAASQVVSVVALAVVALTAFTGTDPFLGLFAWGSYVAAVGILGLMIGSSVAVVAYFNRNVLGASRAVTVVAPVVAALLMAGLWVLMLLSPQTMIGAPLFGRVHLTLLALPAAGLVLGLARAFAMRRRGSDGGWSRVGQATPVERAAASLRDPVFTDVEL
ncbi:MAG TPA: APC family permease [Micromonosporaceae bacterium]|nr:APC family permease [Micromonosporaceae bacterium]